MLELVNDGPAFDCFTGRVVTLPDGSKTCVDDTITSDDTPILGLRAYQNYLRSLGIQPYEPSHTITTATTSTPTTVTDSAPWFSRAANGDLVIFGHAIKPLYALGGAAAALWLFSSMDGKK